MRYILFALCCVFSLSVVSCTGAHDNALLAVTTCGDSIYFHASSITATDGEIWFKNSDGTGYFQDVDYIIPIGED